MEDYIYILVGIAWVAYSIYSARQKALQKQQSPGLPPKGPSQSSPLPIPRRMGDGKSVLDDLIRGLAGEPVAIPAETRPVAPARTHHSKKVSELNQTYEGYTGYKFISTAEPVSVTRNPDDTAVTGPHHEQMIKNVNIKRNFNLRDAVIFSELLNPKYF